MFEIPKSLIPKFPNCICWKCSRLRVPNCDLFTWDDEIEGHPPYVRPSASEPRNRLRNSNDKATPSGQISCECNCHELDLGRREEKRFRSVRREEKERNLGI
ncbi:hypothetical protein QL285_094680 [Trifolium repens]|nr:hypothetical protein QL285_094680 [Trifolium repens]